MAARGVAQPHRRQGRNKEEYEVPMIAIDYAFLRNAPESPSAVILVGKDRDTG